MIPLTDGIAQCETFEEKQLTRPLYCQAFDDPAPFTDYYYADKCLDNTILVRTEGRQILSMVHLNPYTLSVRGISVPSCYLVAVATDAARRHEGHMDAVMAAAFGWMESRRIPFCYLLPVDEAIYTHLGFETICDFSRECLPFDAVKAQYDVYCLRDAAYRRRTKRGRAETRRRR